MEASISGSEFPKTTEGGSKNDDTKPIDQKKSRFQCSICHKVLCNKQVLQYHEATHAVPAVHRQCFRCDVCGASFTSRTGRNNHMKAKHTESAESKPTDQGKKQDSEDDDFLPETTPAKKNPFQCKICDKVVASKQALQNHEARHVDPEIRRQDYHCEICGASFTSKGGLKYHLNTKHTEEREKLPCPMCERVFKSAEGLKIHMTIQHGEGPVLKCQECPMVFARKAHLDLHMTTHGSGLHTCTLCGKPYARLKDLTKHEATCAVKGPVQPKSFRCGQCSEVFATAVMLRIHERTTHGETLRAKKKGGVEQTKVRMRRSKYDLYLGLEHLADPSNLLEEKPVEKATKPAPLKPNPVEFQCEHCPRKFGSKQGQLNHGMRRHWEAFGLAEPLPERRGRKRTRPEGAKRKRKSRRKIVNFVDAEKLPEEADTDTGEEEDPVESSVFCEDDAEELWGDVESDAEDADAHGIIDPVESIAFSDTFNVQEIIPAEELSQEVKADAKEAKEISKVEPVENIAFCETPNIEDEFKLFDANDVNIKEEFIEFEEFQYAENVPAACNDTVDELKLDEPIVEPQANEELENDGDDSDDDQAFGPFDESEQPQITRELVIRLVKLDYAATKTMRIRKVKSRGKNPFPRTNCEHCGKTFAYQYRLSLHRIKEHGSTETPIPNRNPVKKTLSRDFPCDQCDRAYHLEVNLAAHKAKVHGIGETPAKSGASILTRSCKHCHKKFKSWSGLLYHLKFYHNEILDDSKLHRCTSCKAKFIFAEEMEQHLCTRQYAVDLERLLKCDLCGKRCSTKFQLENHFNSHPEYQHVKCDQCPKGFFNEKQLNSHKRCHKPKDAFVRCKICQKLLVSEENLKLHMKYHVADQVSCCCEQCGRQFDSKRLLSRHVYSKHTVPRKAKTIQEEPVPCPTCGKICTSKKALRSHMVMHTVRIKCTYCEKVFYNNGTRKIHEQSHTKDYKFKCNVCDYGTIRRKMILEHEQQKHNYNRFANSNSAQDVQ